MHEALLTDGGGLAEGDFARLAAKVGLDPRKLATCRDDERHGEALDRAIAAARAAGVGGTPSFLVGASRGDVVEGRLLRGAPTLAKWDEVLSKYLPAP
jgi:2-hydroxychromene-2-carboxylate isomerase